MTDFRVHRDRLASGLLVVTVEMPHLKSAFCAVHVRVGSRHEDAKTNGVSHVLEHLFFRGSHAYPDSVQMNAAVEAVGGNLNGVTMRDSSAYYTPVHPSGVGTALDILGDMLTRPRLVKLATEKRIILEEMLDEVDERGRDIDVDNLSKRQLYPGHPLALKIAGTPKTVQAMTMAAVRAHYRQHYVSGNLVVSVAGPVSRSQVLRSVRRSFKHLRVGPASTEAPPPELPRAGPALRFVSLEEAQVELRLSFPAASEQHPDFAALSLLRRVLDDGLSSRLPYNIVERRGLAYSIGAAVDAFHDAGAFELDGACAPQQVGKVVAEVLRTLATLRRGEIAADELKRAKRRYRMHHEFLADSPSELSSWFGGQSLFREPESFEVRCRRADAVTVRELRRVARKYLDHRTLAVVAVGPRRARKPLVAVLARAAGLLR